MSSGQEEEERANGNLKLYVFSAAGGVEEDCRAKKPVGGKDLVVSAL